MNQKKGKNIKTFDGKKERFSIISLDNKGEYGLYDAEIDDIVMVEKINMTKDHQEETIRVSQLFNKEIKKLKKEN